MTPDLGKLTPGFSELQKGLQPPTPDFGELTPDLRRAGPTPDHPKKCFRLRRLIMIIYIKYEKCFFNITMVLGYLTSKSLLTSVHD